MKFFTHIRSLLIFAALVMFIYQTVQALLRYVDSPTVIVNSETKFRDEFKPRVIVCPKDLSIDLSRHREIGYKWTSDLLAGKMKDYNNILSWFGNSSSLTWEQMIDFVIKNRTLDMTFFSGSGEETIEELGILLPYFKCYEIKNFGNKLSMGSKLDYNVYLVDQNRELNSRIMKVFMTGDSISQEHRSSTKLASNNYFTVSTTQIKKRQDTGTCSNEEFSECSLKAYHSKFQELLNCVPPWISFGLDDKDICLAPVRFDDIEVFKATVKYINEFVIELRIRDEVGLENENCLESCTHLLYDIKNVGSEKAAFDLNWINISFRQKVKIEEEVSNYNEFSLIVEIGSCLGLWLGLCISSIYDLFIQLGHYVIDFVPWFFDKVKGKTS